jgi:hypothetical protein
LEVFDLTGRLAGSFLLVGGQGLYSFDVSELPMGMYIYRVSTNGDAIMTDRLVIVKQQ